MMSMIMKIERYISMSDFKKNPAKALRDAHSQPVAVLRRNTAAFYLVDPTSFEALIDAAEDGQLMPLLRERIANAQKGNYAIVDVDTI
jgi:antitoxin StbD